MARRFNDLNERMVNALRSGATIESLMADTNKDEALRNYVKYITYQTPADHKRGASSTRQLKGTVKKNIVPFNMELATGDALQVPISKRTDEYLQANPAIATAAQHQTLASGKFAYPTRGWYSAAKCIFRKKSATQNTVQASQNKITKQEYKTYFGPTQDGYVVPFGKTGTETDIQRRQAMTTAVASVLTAGYGISFKSEKINIIPEKGT